MKLTADSIVLTGSGEELSLLLIKRKNPPFQGEHAFPGGFLEKGEDPLLCAKRELKEETGLKIRDSFCCSLSIRKKDGRDPRGPVTTYPFLFYIDKPEKVKGEDDALEAVWIKICDIEKLAFDHGAILAEALGLFFPFMGRGKNVPQIELPTMFSGGKDLGRYMDRVTFFGGSFNPPHMGHKSCLMLCPSIQKIVVPDSNPWKECGKNSGCYWKLLKKICSFFSDIAPVYPGFFGKESGNYSASWLENVSSINRELILGDDTFKDLFEWYDYKKLLNSLSKIWVVPRSGSIEERIKVIKKIEASFKLTVEVLPVHEYQDLSSTSILKKEL